ncbi:hypothetical protein BKA70DRAFT_1433284 [Coprinopsis sp. MPI-PUGE-AT-0042]|nr:hypothetical protein BKA70DRAFT_1433284 [Coprinopsis sp. MPI-PUGE-AT-0042]
MSTISATISSNPELHEALPRSESPAQSRPASPTQSPTLLSSSEGLKLEAHSRPIRRSPRRHNPVGAVRSNARGQIPEAEQGELDGHTRQFNMQRCRENAADVSQADSLAAFQNNTDEDTLRSLRITIERQKRQLQVKVKALERAREELGGAKQQFSELEKELEEKEEELTTLRKNEQQYRNWWLNEIQFTKLLLNKVPNPNRDIELVRASQAHYLGHY